MLRRMVPLTVAIVLVIGCKKKSGDTGGTEEGDPNATYTLKLREAQQGDKSEVTSTETATIDFTGKGQKLATETKLEYTEHIIEMPAGEAIPTKLTRAYRVAKSTELATKQLKSMPIEGKTVTIEKKGKEYQFKADGKELDFIAKMQLQGEFSNAAGKGKMDVLLPKQPVKVGESWTVPLAAVKSFMGNMAGGNIDEGKSKVTCKLARAYSQEGKQRGVIEFDFDIHLSAPATKGKPAESGTMKLTGSLDAVIDGTARDMTLKGNVKASGSGPAGAGELEGTVEKTIKPAS